jgi:predicted ATP-grasp superfamily ATP-dependent carboligase
VEVLEHTTGVNALAWHQQVFEFDRLPRRPPPDLFSMPGGTSCVGKAILFAPRTFSFPADGPWTSVLRAPPSPAELPAYADIPAAGEVIREGRPVLTFFVRAESPAACEANLREVVGDLDQLLFPQ